MLEKTLLDADYPKDIPHTWEENILKEMYPENNKELEWDKKLNQIDWAMPYRALPVLFLVFWISFGIYAIYAYFNQECAEPSENLNVIQTWYNQYFNVFQ